MQGWLGDIIDKGTACWACPVFDNLFIIISNTAASVYTELSKFGLIIFGVLFAFYVLNSVWQNIKNGMPDPFFQKSLRPVLIKSVAILSLLATGLYFPKFISRVTFEPAALMTLEYSKNLVSLQGKFKSEYTPIKIDDSGFFNRDLRDTILELIQSNLTYFQQYIKFGMNLLDNIFVIPKQSLLSWLAKRFLILFIGLYLIYYFGKLFVQYSFCFMDIIVAMAMFSLFFPLSLVFSIFQGAQNLPDWMKNLGKNLGSSQIKKLVSAIVSVVASILGYTIIIIMIRGYLTGADLNITNFDQLIDFDLDKPSAIQVTFFGSITLLFVANYIAAQIPDIKKEILKTLGLEENDSVSEKTGKDTWNLTEVVKDQTKQIIKNRFAPEETGAKTETPAKK